SVPAGAPQYAPCEAPFHAAVPSITTYSQLVHVKMNPPDDAEFRVITTGPLPPASLRTVMGSSAVPRQFRMVNGPRTPAASVSVSPRRTPPRKLAQSTVVVSGETR